VRSIRIIQLSETEILIHDDEGFVMRVTPHTIDSAGAEFIGITEANQWWLKLVMERGPHGHDLWLRQEQRTTNGRAPSGTIISPVGTFAVWDAESQSALALANTFLGRSNYAVVWFEESQSYIGNLIRDITWINEPNRIEFVLQRTIQDHDAWKRVQVEAQEQARLMGIAFVENLDPEPA